MTEVQTLIFLYANLAQTAQIAGIDEKFPGSFTIASHEFQDTWKDAILFGWKISIGLESKAYVAERKRLLGHILHPSTRVWIKKRAHFNERIGQGGK